MVSDYIIAFNSEEYNELKELAQINTELDKIISCFEFDKEHWFCERTRMEYCMLLLQIKRLKKRSSLVSRMIDLGDCQDDHFRSFLGQVERDLARHCESEYEAH